MVLSPKQVKVGLEGLEFCDELLVFLDGALGAPARFGSVEVKPIMHFS